MKGKKLKGILVCYVDDEMYNPIGTKGWFCTVSDEVTIYANSACENIKLFKEPKSAFDWGVKNYNRK